MKTLLHWLAHKIGRNYGRVHSELRGNEIWIGFKCDWCGKIDDFHKSVIIYRAMLEAASRVPSDDQ